MTDSELDALVSQAMRILNAAPNKRMGNGKLRGLLNLDEGDYAQVKGIILDQKMANSGRGRGGSLFIDEAVAAKPEPQPAPAPEPTPVPAPAQPSVTATRKPPFQVSGRDFNPDDRIDDPVVKAFVHRPSNNRNEYCLEVFDTLRQRNLTYPGIRQDRQEVDKALRGGYFVSTDVLSRIHEKANDALSDLGLVIDTHIGLVRE